MKRKDIQGRKFGKLTVIRYVYNIGPHAAWECICECGNKKNISGNNLRNGITKSCGCLWWNSILGNKNCITHGMSLIPEYKVWQSMKNRCSNQKNQAYCDYGGRGIKVCKEWRNSFERFYKDMGKRPNGKSLDRINNDGNYCKENCQWSDIKTQNKNRRKNGCGRRYFHKV